MRGLTANEGSSAALARGLQSSVIIFYPQCAAFVLIAASSSPPFVHAHPTTAYAQKRSQKHSAAKA